MSGIFGAYSIIDKDVAETGFLGTVFTQNRGEVGAGMTVGKYDIPKPQKEEGLAFVVLQKELDLFKMIEPYMAIGHTRFGLNRGLQPNNFDGKRYKSTISMDGITMDASEFETQQRLHDLLEYTGNIIDASEKFMNEFYGRGIYSILWGILDKKTGDLYMVGLRDPHGVKPLWKGKKNNTYLLSSETAGITGSRAIPTEVVEPGSVNIFTGNYEPTTEILKYVPHYHCFFGALYFQKANSIFENSGKSSRRIRRNIGRDWVDYYWNELKKINPDFFLASPDSGIGFREGVIKGFNDRLILEKLKEGVPVYPNDIKESLMLIGKNPGAVRTFLSEIDIREYRSGTKFDFDYDVIVNGFGEDDYLISEEIPNVHVLYIHGKKIFVVDDSLVKGTVTESTFEPIEKCGAKVCGFGTSCDALAANCLEDLYDPKRRVAHGLWNKTVEEKNKIVSQDLGYPVFYTDWEIIKKRIGLDDLGNGCLTGIFPIDKKYLPEGYKSLL